VTKLVASSMRTVSVTYETDAPRPLRIKINDVDVGMRWLDGGGWDVQVSVAFSAALPAGVVRFTFCNDDASPAPDIDRVVVS
jgi:hypothetical protein